LRTKNDYNLVEKNGKMTPEKAGTKAIMREGIDYEFTIVLNMDLKHQAKVTKLKFPIFSNA
jgi:hypothetical protein